jgi:hypothetical protein
MPLPQHLLRTRPLSPSQLAEAAVAISLGENAAFEPIVTGTDLLAVAGIR